MTRGWLSTTLVFFEAYVVAGAPGGPKIPGDLGPAERRRRVAREQQVRGTEGLPAGLQVVAGAVDRAEAVGHQRAGTWFGPVPSSAPQGPVAAVVFATCASEILICLRMNARSDGVTLKP